MATMLRPSWPPSPAEPRRPGLRSTKPQRYDATMLARDLLREMVREHHISERDLATCWHITPKLAREKLSGVQPLHFGELFLLPKRIRLVLFAKAMTTDLPTAV